MDRGGGLKIKLRCGKKEKKIRTFNIWNALYVIDYEAGRPAAPQMF